jgi:hypothetical protein
MKRIFSAPTWLLALLLFCATALGLVAPGETPRQLIEVADLVVVGKLTDIEERAFAITHKKPQEWVPSPLHFDVGVIKNPKILKGKLHAGDGILRMAFFSRLEPGQPNRVMFKSHSAGEEGVWFLIWDKSVTGYYFEILPNCPWPLSSEVEITNALKNIESK